MINNFTNRLQLLHKGSKRRINCKCEKKSINCLTGDTRPGFKAYGTMGVNLTGD